MVLPAPSLLLLRLVVLNVVAVLLKVSVPVLESDVMLEVDSLLPPLVLIPLLDGTEEYISDDVVTVESDVG